MRRDGRPWELDEEDDEDRQDRLLQAREAAETLKEQANALSRRAVDLDSDKTQGSAEGRAKLREAFALYRRADELLSREGNGSQGGPAPEDREVVLQCRLNAACLAIKAGDNDAANRLCAQALELDAESPHAALMRSQAEAARGGAAAAALWRQRAGAWAAERGESRVLEQLVSAPEAAPAAEPPEAAPGALVRQGVALLRARRAAEARPVLEQALQALEGSGGGLVEALAARAARAEAFDALEALSEAFAAEGRWVEAVRCGRRAASLLDSGEAPFGEPNVHKRRGLLLLSLGHALAGQGGDPLPDWRASAAALGQAEDPALEGHVLLEIGSWSPGAAAAPALEKAARCFARARRSVGLQQGEATSRAADAAGSAGGRVPWAPRAQEPEARCADCARKELKAQVALASVLREEGDVSEVCDVLGASEHLLDLAPRDGRATPAGSVAEWAQLCERWAFLASAVGSFREAERALGAQLRLGRFLAEAGGTFGAPSKAPPETLEALRAPLRALAVVRRRLRDDEGVEAALSEFAALTPADERDEVLSQLRASLRRVAPPSQLHRRGGSGQAAQPSEAAARTAEQLDPSGGGAHPLQELGPGTLSAGAPSSQGGASLAELPPASAASASATAAAGAASDRAAATPEDREAGCRGPAAAVRTASASKRPAVGSASSRALYLAAALAPALALALAVAWALATGAAPGARETGKI